MAPSTTRRSRPPRTVPRIVCVVGPTASGKTALGLRLAELFAGEVVNADSRQIYKELLIGMGTPAGKRGLFEGHRAYLVQGIPHYLMGFLDPTASWTVPEWRDAALHAIQGIAERGHLPILVGGTGLYLRSLIDNFQFPQIPPQAAFREALEAKPLEDLVKLLVALDPSAAESVDLKNPRRVIRALEVVTFTGKSFTAQKTQGVPLVEALQVGIRWPRAELRARCDVAVDEMFARGWVEEVRQALRKGISATAPAMTAIGYREILQHLQGTIDLARAIELTKFAVHQYAKRQETWFTRDPRVRWAATQDEAVQIVREWLGTKNRG